MNSSGSHTVLARRDSVEGERFVARHIGAAEAHGIISHCFACHTMCSVCTVDDVFTWYRYLEVVLYSDITVKVHR